MIDRIVGEPLGGAHREPGAAIHALGDAIEESLRKLDGMSPESLRQARRAKFLAMGRI